MHDTIAPSQLDNPGTRSFHDTPRSSDGDLTVRSSSDGAARTRAETDLASNAISALTLYRYHGCWVYDDANFNRIAEPLVLGASELLDSIILLDTGAPTRNPVGVLFSATEFPGAHAGTWLREEAGGNWYSLGGQEAWLCPALLDYFHEAPSTLWVRAHSLNDDPSRLPTAPATDPVASANPSPARNGHEELTVLEHGLYGIGFAVGFLEALWYRLWRSVRP